jgi:hypothetical protein
VALIDAMIIVRCVIKLSIDGYMFFRFYQSFVFFVNYKKRYIKRVLGNSQDLDAYNQLIIWAVMILYVLCILNCLSITISWALIYSSIIQV